MLLASVFSCLVVVAAGWFDLFSREAPKITGVPCSENQVIRSVKINYDDSIEVECGPIPCGQFGRHCVDDQIQCRTEHDYYLSGMRWAPDNDSVLLRCCKLQTKKKTLYVGTEELEEYRHSYYEEENGGTEYNFIANVRTEGHFSRKVRIWVYRIMCENGEEPTTAAPEPIDSVVEEEGASGEASGEEMAYEDSTVEEEEASEEAFEEEMAYEVSTVEEEEASGEASGEEMAYED